MKMRPCTQITILSAAASLALLFGCSGAGTLVKVPTAASARAAGRVATNRHFLSYYSCPAAGRLVYISDYNNNLINIYAGKLQGQAPCGRLTAKLLSPWGLFVKPDTHDLYVANDGAQDVLVFHRGQTHSYNTYTDPTQEDPAGVTVALDGTVIASNMDQIHFANNGSISTWIGGPNGGTFVGNFATANGGHAYNVTVLRNGVIYYDDLRNTNLAQLYRLSCPAGACGPQTQIAGVSLNGPGALAADDTGDLLASDSSGLAETFEMPNPTPSTFPISVGAVAMAIDEFSNHWYVTDAFNNDAEEYYYPGGKLVGKVPGSAGDALEGIAVDP
jgi:hypothetical protein